jgi:retinal rod rhodopsin-sensitive cGMP 3',5'-cyclic phosphodiesterase subunit delta
LSGWMGEQGEIAVSDDPRAQKIFEGFRIDAMNMRDATSGTAVGESEGAWDKGTFAAEREVHVPASILGCRAISREITFSSVELIDKFRLEQRIFLHGQVCSLDLAQPRSFIQ